MELCSSACTLYPSSGICFSETENVDSAPGDTLGPSQMSSHLSQRSQGADVQLVALMRQRQEPARTAACPRLRFITHPG